MSFKSRNNSIILNEYELFYVDDYDVTYDPSSITYKKVGGNMTRKSSNTKSCNSKSKRSNQRNSSRKTNSRSTSKSNK